MNNQLSKHLASYTVAGGVVLGLIIISSTAIVCIYSAVNVLSVAQEYKKLAIEAQRADIQVCAGALPENMRISHRIDIKPIPIPDPDPCGEERLYRWK